MGVTLGVAGIEARGADGHLEVGLARILAVEVAGAGEVVERTPDLGDHGAADNEADRARSGSRPVRCGRSPAGSSPPRPGPRSIPATSTVSSTGCAAGPRSPASVCTTCGTLT